MTGFVQAQGTHLRGLSKPGAKNIYNFVLLNVAKAQHELLKRMSNLTSFQKKVIHEPARTFLEQGWN